MMPLKYFHQLQAQPSSSTRENARTTYKSIPVSQFNTNVHCNDIIFKVFINFSYMQC